MTLISRMQSLNDRLQSLPERFGLPSVTSVVLVKDDLYTVMAPKPQQKQINPQKVGGFIGDNVEIMADDIWLTNVSRSYTIEQLSTSTWLLDATLEGDNWQGKRCKCLDVRTDDPLTYAVLVRSYEDR